jgi:hypothetical protein
MRKLPALPDGFPNGSCSTLCCPSRYGGVRQKRTSSKALKNCRTKGEERTFLHPISGP